MLPVPENKKPFSPDPQKPLGPHKLGNEIEQKSSLKYVNPEVIKVRKCHSTWSTVRNSVDGSRRAQLKCKLLTGTYILQANRAVLTSIK